VTSAYIKYLEFVFCEALNLAENVKKIFSVQRSTLQLGAREAAAWLVSQ